jgi:hypothetical protein
MQSIMETTQAPITYLTVIFNIPKAGRIAFCIPLPNDQINVQSLNTLQSEIITTLRLQSYDILTILSQQQADKSITHQALKQPTLTAHPLDEFEACV